MLHDGLGFGGRGLDKPFAGDSGGTSFSSSPEFGAWCN